MYSRKLAKERVCRALFCSTAFVLIHVCAANAADINIPPDQFTTQVLTDDGDTLTVDETGTIDTSGVDQNAVEAIANDQTIDNAGTINGNSVNGAFDGVFSTGIGNTIINRATGQIIGSDDAIQSNGAYATIINDGLLQGGWGVFSTGEHAVVTNNNEIDTLSAGILSWGNFAEIINNGLIDSEDEDGIVSEGHYATIINGATGQIFALEDAIQSDGAYVTIVNDGLLQAAFGVFSQGDYAVITNNNDIDASQAGIHSLGNFAEIINNGLIDVEIMDGIYSGGHYTTIINGATGVIIANDADDDTDEEEDAIHSDGDFVTIINDGLLQGNWGVFSTGEHAVITNNNEIDTRFTGILSWGNSAEIINNGLIDSEDEDGIVSDGHYDTIINGATGQIFAWQDAIESDGYHVTIINEGLLRADYGVYSTGDYAVITNNNEIDAGVYGVQSEGDFARIINNATILADAYGVVSYGDYATIINNALIRSEDSDGVYSEGDFATIINAATIIASDNAIRVIGDNVTVILQAGSVLDGGVSFEGAGGLTLNIGKGLNLYLDYDGTIGTLNSEVPFVHDEANGIVYTVDPTGLALSQSFLQTVADAVHEAVRSGAGEGNSFGGGFSGNGTFDYGPGAPGFSETGPRAWIHGFGGYLSQDGSGAVTGGDQSYGGLVAGGEMALAERMYGAFLGGSYAQLQTDYDTQNVDATSAYGGLYGGMTSGVFWIQGSLLAGYSDFTSERIVANNTVSGGLETASADYDGFFVSPSVTVGRAIGDRVEISIGGHYAGLFLDGYTETGSSANLTIASRDVHLAAVRAKLSYLAQQRRLESGLVSLETWVGIDGVFNLGADVEATVAGLPFDTFPATFQDAAIGFAGVGISHRPTNGNWSFDGSLEGRYGTENYAEIRAAATLALEF